MCYDYYYEPPKKKLMIVGSKRDGLSKSLPDFEFVEVGGKPLQEKYEYIVFACGLYAKEMYEWAAVIMQRAPKDCVIWTD